MVAQVENVLISVFAFNLFDFRMNNSADCSRFDFVLFRDDDAWTIRLISIS